VDFLDKVLTLKTTPTPSRKMQGGISDISELEGVIKIHPAFLSAFFKPAVTITHKNITFNPSCIKFFPDCQYFSVCIDEASLRLIAAPATEKDENALKVAYFRNGKYVPRPCTAKHLCPVLFEIMKWNPEAKYRVEPDIRGFEDTKFLVFNLDEGQEVSS